MSDSEQKKRQPNRFNSRLGYQLVPKDPTYAMLKMLAGSPVILAASDEEELRRRYADMLNVAPTR